MFKKLTSAGLILALVAPTAVLAGDAAAMMDADGDGMVTMSEFNEAMPDAGTEVFAEVDANADGALSEEEIATAKDSGVLPDMSSRG